MTLTRAQTHTHEDFANPYLVCGQCGQPATGYHDQIQCGCDTGYRLLPCRHTAEAEGPRLPGRGRPAPPVTRP